MRLRKATINYLESEFIYYKHLSRGIERIRNSKAYPHSTISKSIEK